MRYLADPATLSRQSTGLGRVSLLTAGSISPKRLRRTAGDYLAAAGTV